MATKANIIMDQGTTFSTTIFITDDNGDPVDLSGYTGRSQIRKHHTSSNAVSFSVSLTEATGVVSLGLTANQTSSLISGRYVYDVEVVSSANVVSRIIEGIVTVTPEVTR
jgi:hypothetical protein